LRIAVDLVIEMQVVMTTASSGGRASRSGKALRIGLDNHERLAAWEMTAGQTPPKVVIDEAIELAKSFSTAQSPGFVNAVLDSVLKEHKQLTESA